MSVAARPAPEDVVAVGWHIDDHATFEEIESRMRAHSVPHSMGTAEAAELRGVERLLRFPGLKRLTQEIYATSCPVRAAPHTRLGLRQQAPRGSGTSR